MSARLDYKSSTFSDHDGTIENSEDRVIMDDFWITDKIEEVSQNFNSKFHNYRVVSIYLNPH